MSTFNGIYTAMATPFAADGSVDYEGGASLAKYLLEHGSDGLVVAGSTGEVATLTDPEQIELLRAVRDAVGTEVMIICGTGTNDTRHSIELTKAADAAGSDAMLVVTPYYNKPNPRGMRAHVEAVAGCTDKPIVLYNIPSRSVVNVPPAQLADLAEIDNVVAVKQANDDDLGPIDGLELLAGNDDVFLRCLELGGVGGITVASHIVGDEMAKVRELFTSGDLEGARELDSRLQPLFEALSITTNPMPVKGALEMLGICSSRMRLPMVELDEGEKAVVRSALQHQGLLPVNA